MNTFLFRIRQILKIHAHYSLFQEEKRAVFLISSKKLKILYFLLKDRFQLKKGDFIQSLVIKSGFPSALSMKKRREKSFFTRKINF